MDGTNERARDIVRDIIELEGKVGSLVGDKGLGSAYGLSGRYYPNFVAKVIAGQAGIDDAVDIYVTNYVTRISGWQQLVARAPGIFTLLLAGRIHGIGDKHYTEVIQEELNRRVDAKLTVDGIWGPATCQAFLNAGQAVQDGVFGAIKEEIPALGAMRMTACDNPHTELDNSWLPNIPIRVAKEYDLAQTWERKCVTSTDPLAIIAGTDVPFSWSTQTESYAIVHRVDIIPIGEHPHEGDRAEIARILADPATFKYR